MALVAACITSMPCAGIAAQQTCLPAHDVARGLVTSFLIAPSELTRRQAYGITAIRLEDLRPLTDARDAALCQRMDSTITQHPVYYFSAGRYIIATNSVETVVWPDSFAFKTDEITRHVFLFDSAGYFAYTVGARMPAIAPTDLHAVSAYSGRVALAWTNGASTAMRYQLQRTSGGGAFVPIGPALLGSRTSTTDSTALADSTYRYRLDAVGPAGDSTYSNEVTIVPQGVGTITRTATGLLFRDDFNRADGPPGANWVIESGSWAIVGNKLQATITCTASPPGMPASFSH